MSRPATKQIARHFARVTFTSDNRGDLAAVRVPTVILPCSEHIIAPTAVGKYVHDVVPGSTLVQLQATGHCPNLSAPEETVAAGRRRFLDLLTGGGRIYDETHFAPLLRMQGEVRSIAFELRRADGTTMPVLSSRARRPSRTRSSTAAVTTSRARWRSWARCPRRSSRCGCATRDSGGRRGHAETEDGVCG